MILLRTCSVTIVILSIAICSIQSAVIVSFTGILEHTSGSSLDKAAVGLWSSLLMSVSALYGFVSSFKIKRSLLLVSIILSILSISSALIGATLSGIMASSLKAVQQPSIDNYCYRLVNGVQQHFVRDCIIWAGLEWTLVALYLTAVIVTAIFLREVSILLKMSLQKDTDFVYKTVPLK